MILLPKNIFGVTCRKMSIVVPYLSAGKIFLSGYQFHLLFSTLSPSVYLLLPNQCGLVRVAPFQLHRWCTWSRLRPSDYPIALASMIGSGRGEHGPFRPKLSNKSSSRILGKGHLSSMLNIMLRKYRARSCHHYLPHEAHDRCHTWEVRTKWWKLSRSDVIWILKFTIFKAKQR